VHSPDSKHAFLKPTKIASQDFPNLFQRCFEDGLVFHLSAIMPHPMSPVVYLKLHLGDSMSLAVFRYYKMGSWGTHVFQVGRLPCKLHKLAHMDV